MHDHETTVTKMLEKDAADVKEMLKTAWEVVGGALLVSHGGLDMTSAILNAFRSVWPEIICTPAIEFLTHGKS